MRLFYSRWDDGLSHRLREMQDLMRLFNEMLLRVNGDVKTALKIMSQLKKMGYLRENADLEAFRKELLRSKIITTDGRSIDLTRRGERALRRDALDRVFEQLRSSGIGNHLVGREGGWSEEELPERRRFSFGDSLRNIDFTSSLLNAIARSGSLSLDLAEGDLEVHETEQTTGCATVMLIDISHSMILYGEDRMTPAKQVALAFAEMILTRFPKDELDIVLFGDFAQRVQIKDLPYIGVGPYHTNTKAGLQMARQLLLKKRSANRQIFMITDGKPSMITRSDGTPHKNPFGLDPLVVNRTLDEAIICRRKRIPITTFMVADDPHLRRFVQTLTELNHGRAYFASAANLGEYVFWDFLKHRRKAA